MKAIYWVLPMSVLFISVIIMMIRSSKKHRLNKDFDERDIYSTNTNHKKKKAS